MAIEYVEIRNTARELIGIIDTAKSVIWHSVYTGVGDFEVYAKATPEHLRILKTDYYVTRPDELEIGIIDKIETTQNAEDGFMIVASGRFAKSILDRRLIYNLSGNSNRATVLSGNVESAARALVANNLISCAFDPRRNITILELGAHSGSTAIIVDGNGNAAKKQVSYQNLLEYTDGLLEEYNMSAMVVLNDETKKLQYIVYTGADRSADNTAGNEPIIFSREYDNLTESHYVADNTAEKNTALIGGEGEGVARFYTLLSATETGLDRKELWVDASSISKKYKDEQEQEQDYSDEEYTAMLKSQGKQTLSEMKATETFSGTLNVTYGVWLLNRDYMLGDIVTVQDNQIGKYANVRITEITEVQDENGYTVSANYE